mmetsp:Transcript_32387/g.82744  ORF Transcript_32387/g.82744 Transcript_32387/m.82744 type:complete len:207 (-) Transcript_32387:305-925(-)
MSSEALGEGSARGVPAISEGSTVSRRRSAAFWMAMTSTRCAHLLAMPGLSASDASCEPSASSAPGSGAGEVPAAFSIAAACAHLGSLRVDTSAFPLRSRSLVRDWLSTSEGGVGFCRAAAPSVSGVASPRSLPFLLLRRSPSAASGAASGSAMLPCGCGTGSSASRATLSEISLGGMRQTNTQPSPATLTRREQSGVMNMPVTTSP